MINLDKYEEMKEGDVLTTEDIWNLGDDTWVEVDGLVGGKVGGCNTSLTPDRCRRLKTNTVASKPTNLLTLVETKLILELIDETIGNGMNNVLDAGHLCNAFVKLRETTKDES